MCYFPKCKAPSAPGSSYCKYHTPEEVAKRRKARFAQQDAKEKQPSDFIRMLNNVKRPTT